MPRENATPVIVWFSCQDSVDFDIADKNGKTPLMLAVGRKHDKIIHFLKKHAKQRSSLLPKIDIW